MKLDTLTNEQTGSLLRERGVVVDPLVEDAQHQEAEHAEEEDQRRDEVTDDVQRLVEVAATPHTHCYTVVYFSA